MKLPVPISFDWDKGNINKSWEKHKVHFKEAEEIFFNKPIKIFSGTKHSIEEKRFIALGVTDSLRKLAVIFTIRNEKIRVISARDQNRKEKEKYV